jgi:hypothetical protein
MSNSKHKSSMTEAERIVEMEAILQSVINERNEAWSQLDKCDLTVYDTNS